MPLVPSLALRARLASLALLAPLLALLLALLAPMPASGARALQQGRDRRCPRSFRLCGELAVDPASLPDLLYRSAGHVRPVEPVDLASDADALREVGKARSYRGELIVLAATRSHWAYAANAVTQLHQLRMEHYIVVAPSLEDCVALQEKTPKMACVYSTLVSTDAHGDTQWSVWTTRKRYVGRWTALGLGVLQADLDMIFFENPYPALKGSLADLSLVHLQEGRCHTARANGGLLYAQHACMGSVAHWVLREVFERAHRIVEDPRVLNTYYPGGDLLSDGVDLDDPGMYRKYVHATSDEQALLRDALMSAFVGKEMHFLSVQPIATSLHGFDAWRAAYDRAKGGEFSCAKVAMERDAVPGVCYDPSSNKGASLHAVARTLTAPAEARANRDPDASDVLCLDPPAEYGGFAPYELFGSVASITVQRDQVKNCSYLADTFVAPTLWGRPRVSPASVVHLVGASHPGRGVIMRALGAWDYTIAPLIVPGVDTAAPASRMKRALGLAHPAAVEAFASLHDFEAMLAALHMIADATGRTMAAPAMMCPRAPTNTAPWWSTMNAFLQMPVGREQVRASASLQVPQHASEPPSHICVWLMRTSEWCTEWDFLHPPDLDRLVVETGGLGAVATVSLDDLLLGEADRAALEGEADGGGAVIAWDAEWWARYDTLPDEGMDFVFDAEKLESLLGREEAVVLIDLGGRETLPWGIANVRAGSRVDEALSARARIRGGCTVLRDAQRGRPPRFGARGATLIHEW